MKKNLFFFGLLFLIFIYMPGTVNTQESTEEEDEILVPSNLLGIRLNRTTSTLTEGTPVDITPYILHDQSIVSVPVDNGFQQLNAIQRQNYVEQQRLRNQDTINRALSAGVLTSSTASTFISTSNALSMGTGFLAVALGVIDLVTSMRDYRFYEFDMDVSFQDSTGQNYSFQITASACEKYKRNAKDKIEERVEREVAKMLGIDPDSKRDMRNLKKFKIRELSNHEGDTKLPMQYNAIFIQNRELGYYHQFDVEVEYQKTRETKKQQAEFNIFDKVYRSNLKTLGAATIDVQHRIWDDAIDLGFRRTPIPAVNFVRSMKVVPGQNPNIMFRIN
jgi:hypothetical protein